MRCRLRSEWCASFSLCERVFILLTGELVCFFLNSSSTRVFSSVNHGRRNASPSPSIVSGSMAGNFAARPFVSSAGTISHAMRGLYRLTNDKSGMPPEPELRPRNPWNDPLQMDNLFIGPVVSSMQFYRVHCILTALTTSFDPIRKVRERHERPAIHLSDLRPLSLLNASRLSMTLSKT